jgi:type III secretion protein D
MKQLRILTGAHAGVRLDLPPRRYTIGSQVDADLELSDWNGAPAELQVLEDGATWAHGLDTVAETLQDFAPRRCGPVVLCVGPADPGTVWPTDLELLARLDGPDAEPCTPLAQRLLRRPQAPWLAVAATAVLALVGMGVSVAGRSSEAMPQRAVLPTGLPAHGNEAVRQRILHLLARHPVWRPSVSGNSDGVAVGGLVPTSTDAAHLRQQLEELGVGRVQHNVVSAATIVERITEGIGQPGLSVRYDGDGRFRVSGTAIDAERARHTASRIAADFGDVVAQVEFELGHRGSAGVLPLRATFSGDGFEYVQTRDGAKHLVMAPPAPSTSFPPAEPASQPPGVARP